MTFEQFLAARGLNESDLDADGIAEQRADFDREMQARSAQDDPPAAPPAPPADPADPPAAPPAPPADPADPPAAPDIDGAVRAALDGERQRVAQIRSEGAEAGINDALITRCIDDGMNIDQARHAYLINMRDARPPSVGAPNIHTRSGDDLSVEALEGALSLRADVPVADAALTRANRRTHVDPEMAERGERYSDLSMIELCREACRIDGVRIPHGRQELIRAAISTATLTNVLANVQNKRMMGGFEESPNTARQWVRMTDVNDFKPNLRLRLGEAEDLAPVGNGGEVEFGQTSDIGESFSLEQHAQLIVFSEQDMINDDLGALTDQPRRLGAAAARLEQDKVYRILLLNAALGQDAVALFNAAHNNLQTGAGSALSVAQLALLRQGMRKQTDIQGAKLSVVPRHFLYPPELWLLANQLIRSTEVRSKGSTDAADQPTANPIPVLGLNPIEEPRLSAGVGSTAGSATAFYLAADASQQPTIELAFLRGTGRAPRIERVPLAANILGMGWRVVHQVNAAPLDFRGLQKSDGA